MAYLKPTMTFRHSVVFAGLFAALVASGCKKKEIPPPVPETTSAAVATYAVGDKVDVKWNNSWWKGEILSSDSGKYKVHYTGWSSTWDESVTPDRLRAPTSESKVGSSVEGTGSADPAAAAASAPAAAATPSPAPAAASAYKVGDKVDVNWKGTWYQGKILSAGGGNYKIHYIGWASSWDESVPASRIRAWTGKASKGSKPE